MTAERDARNETTWKVDTDPTPLDTLAVSPLGIECWYRIPSWRVHFDHEALRDYDIRLHRAIGSHGVWTLTEASTGLKMHGDMPHEFYIGDESGMLAEFAAFKLKQLTPVKMADAISKGREMLNKRTPNPFAAPSTQLPPEANELAAALRDAARWRALKELAGYLGDGSQETVTLYQDDATRSCFIKVGDGNRAKRYGKDGSSFNGIMDELIGRAAASATGIDCASAPESSTDRRTP